MLIGYAPTELALGNKDRRLSANTLVTRSIAATPKEMISHFLKSWCRWRVLLVTVGFLQFSSALADAQAGNTNPFILRTNSGLRGFVPDKTSPDLSSPVLSPEQQLRRKLNAIKFAKDVPAAEQECAQLLLEYTNSPQVTGRFYLALAENYSRNFRKNPNGALDHVIECAEKSLEYPLAPDDACQAYVYIGSSLQAKIMGLKSREADAARKRALVALLKGIKLVLDKAPTLQRQPVPVVHMFETTGAKDSPGNQFLEQRYEREMQAHKEAMENNRLVLRFAEFKGLIICLYRGVPYTDEILAEGGNIMPNSAVLKELLNEIEKTEPQPK